MAAQRTYLAIDLKSFYAYTTSNLHGISSIPFTVI